jgi:hypothetical protein
MRVNTDARLPQNSDVLALKQRLYELHREVSVQLNALAEGQVRGASNAASAAPTSGVYAVGDVVRNLAPTELGSSGSRYVVTGWMCTAAPLTFLPLRSLTGN